MTNDGGQAFPLPAGNFSGGESWASDLGMSLRDYFAAASLSGLAAAGRIDADLMAAHAYEIADAMLRKRAR